MSEVEMAQGIVKWFNNCKGFGFIDPGDGSGDIFAHYSAITMDGYKTLPQGSTVSYELIQGPKGRLAQSIALISVPAREEEGMPRSRLRTPQFRANQLKLRSEST
jgi:CspA family cold shock protein